MGGLKPWHIIVMVLIVLLLFGSAKLPDLARSAGRSMRIFKSEVDEMRDDKKDKQETPQVTQTPDGQASPLDRPADVRDQSSVNQTRQS